jgi:predicted lipid-binding transport protein (Tim44 family)
MPDTQVLEILVIAMIAGVILFRLYTVLGRRTGHEPPPPQAGRSDAPRAIAPPPSEAASATQSSPGLLEIQLADRNFEPQHFLQGAKSAYDLIVTAFQKGDRAALKPLLSDEVFAAFDGAIAARGSAQGPVLTSLRDARIAHASVTGGQAEITVAFSATFAEGKDVTDVWTFARRIADKNPNWTLVATSGDLPE